MGLKLKYGRKSHDMLSPLRTDRGYDGRIAITHKNPSAHSFLLNHVGQSQEELQRNYARLIKIFVTVFSSILTVLRKGIGKERKIFWVNS